MTSIRSGLSLALVVSTASPFVTQETLLSNWLIHLLRLLTSFHFPSESTGSISSLEHQLHLQAFTRRCQSRQITLYHPILCLLKALTLVAIVQVIAFQANQSLCFECVSRVLNLPLKKMLSLVRSCWCRIQVSQTHTSHPVSQWRMMDCPLPSVGLKFIQSSQSQKVVETLQRDHSEKCQSWTSVVLQSNQLWQTSVSLHR